MKFLRWIPLGLLMVPVGANALVYTMNTTSGGYNYKARAEFTYSGSTLTVVLTNTQTSNAVAASNAQVLTGLFWNFNVAPTSPTASAGSSSFVDGNGNVIGGPAENPAQHWAYASGSMPWSNVNFGVASAGYLDPSTPFQGGGTQPILNGVDYGLVGGNWNIGGNQGPLIISSMTFTFNVGLNYNVNSIDFVRFQYGSGLDKFGGSGDEEFPPNEVVPEPASMAMAGFAAAAAISARRRMKNSKN